MANWVAEYLAQNPDIARLEVVKRARHSLHVRTGQGEVLGLFTGAPCHYEENGVWRPLDTALQYDAIRGRHYAPGCPVWIDDEGGVHLSDTGYAQRTMRVGLFNQNTRAFRGVLDVPRGERDGASLIAEGNVWRRVLTLTETGVQEELILTERPNVQATAADWLVLETRLYGLDLPDGWLDEHDAFGVHFPLPRAYDADGNETDCRRYARTVGGQQYLYTGVPVSWLATARYPVTIDPDFTADADTGYYGQDATYSTARSTSSGSLTQRIGQRLSSAVYYVYRAYVSFDTSAIGADTEIDQVNLTLTAYNNNAATSFDVQIVKYSWGGQARETAYDGALSSDADDSIWRNTSGMFIDTPYTSGNLSTAWPSKTGTTYYALRSSRDKNANTPTGNEYMNIRRYDDATAGYRPILTVLYTASASFWRMLMGVGI